MSKLFGEIMNLPLREASQVDMTDRERLAYKIGHRDARHDAAELALGRDENEASDAPIAAIAFALETDEGMEFLRCWNQGDFDSIRREWPEAPEAVFIGADPLHPKS